MSVRSTVSADAGEAGAGRPAPEPGRSEVATDAEGE
jgi:hypothetical protein